MLGIVVAALVFAQGQAQAVQATGAVEVRPSTDTAQQRVALRDMSMCLARSRPRWAVATLSHPYLSREQASSASQALSGSDLCVRGPEAEVVFRTSSMIGGLADHYIVANAGGADINSLARALATIKPLNPSEDFALCIAARDPVSARALALSQPGSAAETAAGAKLANVIRPCIGSGEKPVVEMQSLRALVSVALYRGMTSLSRASR